jgi:hypothetical protein
MNVGIIYFLKIDVNKAINTFNEDTITEMYIQPEKVTQVDAILSRTSMNCGAEGSYIFAYLPMYAIKSSTLLQEFEVPGVNYLNFEQYTNVPVTIDGKWFLKMQVGEMYHADISKDGVYAEMYRRGVREFYSYPVIGEKGIVYGNVTVMFDEEAHPSDEIIKQYLRGAAQEIVVITGK